MIFSIKGVIYINEDMISVLSCYTETELGDKSEYGYPPLFTLEIDNHVTHRLTP